MLLFLTIALPMLGGAAMGLMCFSSAKFRGIYVETIVLATSILTWVLLLTRTDTTYVLCHMNSELALAFRVDGMSCIFAGLVSILWPLASLYGSNSQAAQGSGRAVGSRQSAQAAGRTVNGTVQPRVTGDMHARTASGFLSFGELPDTAKLRAAGHAKIDHSIRWVQRKEDGLYLQSRYGVTRLSPVGSGILRVTFSRGEMPPVHPAIAVTRVEKNWQMREKPTIVEMRTPEMYVVADKKTGALRFLDKDSEILLEESRQDRCLIENAPNGGRSRLFFDWKKGEGLYAAGALGKGGIHLEKTARCISHGVENELPYLISDRGYGILLASSKEVIFCSLPVYGNQICLEGTQQPDYYIIVGKKLETLLKACAYLCGKL